MRNSFTEVAFNLPIDSLFTYSIPEEFSDKIKIGSRVLVNFNKKLMTGITVRFTQTAEYKIIKPVLKLLDETPLLTQEMIDFSHWISSYYSCPIGEVIFSAIPKGILIESKIVYSVAENIPESEKLTPLQKEIIRTLKNKPLSLKQIERKTGSNNLRNTINILVKKKILIAHHRTYSEKIKTRIEKYIYCPFLDDLSGYTQESLKIFLDENKIKNKKQIDAIKYLIENSIREIKLSEFLKNISVTTSSINSLAKKGLIKILSREVRRDIDYEFAPEDKIKILTQEQEHAINILENSVNKNEFRTFLLYGVTGSGKTQVYIEIIKKIIDLNKTAIILVPEISLTPQLINRFRNNFGDIIGLIHSRLTEGQRFDMFQRILNDEVKIVIGARSALFAPLKNIGIFIVDEEHDSSYKQTDKNPKYNARDSAVIRAKLNNAVIILGSATPSLESFYNAENGKYNLLSLPTRALKTKLPAVEIVDMRTELRGASKFQKFEKPETRFLSSKLISEIDKSLKNKQSIILLQNRRGYSAYLECQDCGNVKMCPHCDITMIYHKIKNHLRCHYCGYIEPLPELCDKCGSRNLLLKGTGTEKVEEELERLFPNAKIKRMDADTIQKKDAHRKILRSFYEREFDILLGTQMISKGLDFPNVFLVGVISADIGLFNPDFRSTEKTFQLLSQVSGRSGRSSDLGKVIIQTMHKNDKIFQFISEHDYIGFYKKEINAREVFKYPPFSRMCLFEIRSPDLNRVNSIASKLFLNLKNILKKKIPGVHRNKIEILKPAPALIFKLKNIYRYHIILKTEKSLSPVLTKFFIKETRKYAEKLHLKKNERIDFDVDPISFM